MPTSQCGGAETKSSFPLVPIQKGHNDGSVTWVPVGMRHIAGVCVQLQRNPTLAITGAGSEAGDGSALLLSFCLSNIYI